MTWSQSRHSLFVATWLMTGLMTGSLHAQAVPQPGPMSFDDKVFFNGYISHYQNEPKDTLLAMINDDALDPFKMAAAIHIFKERDSQDIVSREKIAVERSLIRRLNKTDSPFVEVEIFHTLCRIDRYKYFHLMVPALIQKLDHYNSLVNEMSFTALSHLTEGSTKTREASIVFNSLRKLLFLARKRLTQASPPDERLTQKLKLLRWSIKILGTQELKKLPKEAVKLL